MHEISIDLCNNIFSENERLAKMNREKLEGFDIRSFDFLGPVGSGKTKLIEAISEVLKEKSKRMGVIAGDVAGDDDYRRYRAHGLPVKNLNTGKECHLDAHMVDHALSDMDLDEVDILFIENVGNIVCPADFPLGTTMRVMVISVTEGDDMVRKHPMIFQCIDLAVINKIDLAEVMEVDPEGLVRDIGAVNPSIRTLLTDAKHLVGIEELVEALGLLLPDMQFQVG